MKQYVYGFDVGGTCTLTKDIQITGTEVGITIVASGVTLDGAGHTVTGTQTIVNTENIALKDPLMVLSSRLARFKSCLIIRSFSNLFMGSLSDISKILNRNKSTKNRPTIKIDNEVLMEDIKKYPDAYNCERAHRLNVSTSGICCAIKRLGISYKKNLQPSQGLRKKKAKL